MHLLPTYQARLRVAMAHGFNSPVLVDDDIPPELDDFDTDTDSDIGADTDTGIGNEKPNATKSVPKQLPIRESQQQIVNAMLLFLNRVCGRHEASRMKYKQLHVQVMGEIWSQSDMSPCRPKAMKRPVEKSP